MNFENNYFLLANTILKNGILKENRTGVSAYTYPHMMIQHDMENGFPLLTSKKMGIKSISAELEFFIKGLTDKKWLKDRGCNIWNEWCNPSKIPNNLSKEDKIRFQEQENDLGKVYGYQWRNFNSQDYDQLKNILNTIKQDPSNRRLLCSSWNPLEFNEMALPPCHVLWNVQIIGNKLNLCWFQRSVDVFLGLPYNVASYALLLKLICKETGYEEGILTGFLADVHIYENHIDQINEQLSRNLFDLPTLNILNFKSLYEWKFTDIELIDYKSHSFIKAPIAI